MASSITHIVYGEKVKTSFFSTLNLNKGEYFVGTIFPDIRYLGTIRRESTHINNPSISEALNIQDSFDLGFYVHSLVDFEREKTLNELGMYKLVEREPITQTALKLIEDSVNYERFNDWGVVASYFDHIYNKETEFVGEVEIAKWHKLHKDYFMGKIGVSEMAHELNISKETILLVLKKIKSLRLKYEVLQIIEDTYDSIFDHGTIQA